MIISARWLLVLAALLLTLWSPGPDALSDIRLRVPVLLLAAGNFYLHAQTLMRRPIAANLIYTASAADIVVISLLLLTQGGFDSPLYIFYFPALLAFSVAFPRSALPRSPLASTPRSVCRARSASIRCRCC